MNEAGFVVSMNALSGKFLIEMNSISDEKVFDIQK